jgi:hypothetical protein
MKPICYADACTYKYNFLNMCGSIIPLNSKFYYDENFRKKMPVITRITYYK